MKGLRLAASTLKRLAIIAVVLAAAGSAASVASANHKDKSPYDECEVFAPFLPCY